MFRLVLRGSVCLALLACFVGCPSGGGGDYPDTVPVTGSVTYNGSAVDGAMVIFSPAVGGQEAAFGTTDAQGAFALKTHWGADGAVPGNYLVTVSKTGDTPGEATEVEEVEMVIEDPGAAKPLEITQDLPVKYSSGTTTDLKREVKAEGGNDFPLELTD